MSDSAEPTSGTESASGAQSERERIRERKLAELRDRLDGDGEPIGEGGSETDDAAAATATPSEPIHVGGPEEFRRVIADNDVVLVDCYADWCGPCQMMEPTIQALASETGAAVAKVDVDANPQIAQQLGARSIPTLLLYADGEAVDRFVGAQDRATLESAIASHTV
ncbi:thioredoxin [Halorubrum aidingense JCM 13560]|uniref:Thioredoxin n=1 Tax=Halorubrum aidingense JCM 13560 TaxID=1230454 RepID=M0P6Z1_9EURY|nr:thioredoxin [Halorubrum aidingense]EMA65309.1 thioredoxin [Halorubrum aidingense JCM 13560]